MITDFDRIFWLNAYSIRFRKQIYRKIIDLDFFRIQIYVQHHIITNIFQHRLIFFGIHIGGVQNITFLQGQDLAANI